MNSITLTGRIATNIEQREGKNGTKFINFSFAVPTYNSKTKEEEVDFFSCVAFGKRAEFIFNYFSKGRKALIDGTMRTNFYEKDGRKYKNYFVIVNTMEFADSKNKQDENSDSYYSDEFPF